MRRADGAAVRLRAATPADAPILERWDRDADVVAATTDDPKIDVAFGGLEWREELADASPLSFYYLAELAVGVRGWRPIGAMQVTDPRDEPEHYWGDVEANLMAVDIWIGAPEDRGKGYGAMMMQLVTDACFHDPKVKAIVIDPLASNVRAHRFYERLGFKFVERRSFKGDDNCFVFRLSRGDWRKGGEDHV